MHSYHAYWFKIVYILYKPHTILPFGDCAIYHGVPLHEFDAIKWIPKKSSTIWLHFFRYPREVTGDSSSRVAKYQRPGSFIQGMSFFGCDTMMAEITYPKSQTLSSKFHDGLSVESWIQTWIHCLLWCNFSFLNTNKMNMLDGKTLKLRDFCPPGIPQLSWHSKMRSKWRPQWFASLPTSNPGILENSLWKCVCKPVSNHMYQLLFVQKRNLVGC